MKVNKQGDFYRITHITGPRHNAVHISFVEGDEVEVMPPVIEMLPTIGDDRHEPLNDKAILSEVLEGVQQGNSRFGTNYRVKKVQYIQNDTPQEGVYRYMALTVVEHLAKAGR